MRLRDRIKRWLGLIPRVETAQATRVRGRVDHVILIDGSLSTLKPGCETNIGLIYKLLCEMAPSPTMSLRYEAGIQWHHWRSFRDVIEGRGINRQIRRVYGSIASRYRPGDRIFLFGYSRGAYAIRSLAGIIDRVGLLKPEHATVRNIRQIYRHYRTPETSPAEEAFKKNFCYPATEIEMVGIFDTVKALGLRLPILWRWTETKHRFHNHALGPSIRHGYHALALDETRSAFAPVLWETRDDWTGKVEQVWFRGSHGDVGGHLTGHHASRPLSNIPLTWMLGHAADCNLALPEDWQDRFPCDPNAPSVGNWRGWAWIFLSRRKRRVGLDKSESIHPSAQHQGDTLAETLDAPQASSG